MVIDKSGGLVKEVQGGGKGVAEVLDVPKRAGVEVE